MPSALIAMPPATALAAGAAAVLGARDELALHDRSASRDELIAADAAITNLLDRLREGG